MNTQWIMQWLKGERIGPLMCWMQISLHSFLRLEKKKKRRLRLKCWLIALTLWTVFITVTFTGWHMNLKRAIILNQNVDASETVCNESHMELHFYLHLPLLNECKMSHIINPEQFNKTKSCFRWFKTELGVSSKDWIRKVERKKQTQGKKSGGGGIMVFGGLLWSRYCLLAWCLPSG